MAFELFYQTIYYNHRIDQATAINLSHANYLPYFYFLSALHIFMAAPKPTQKKAKKIGSKSESISASSSIFFGKMLATALPRQLTN